MPVFAISWDAALVSIVAIAALFLAIGCLLFAWRTKDDLAKVLPDGTEEHMRTEDSRIASFIAAVFLVSIAAAVALIQTQS